MKRTVLAASISLAVSALLIAGTGSPAAAADTARPHPPKADKSQAVQDARDSIAAHPKAVRASSDDTFKSASVLVDKDGTRHVHMTREYRDLPVLGGDVVVHSAPSGAFRESTLTLKDSLSLPVTPKVSAQRAETLAQKKFQGERADTTSKLVVDALAGTPRLAWQVTVDGIAPDQSPSHFNVLVDALTGKVGQTWNDFHTADGTGHGYQVGDVPLTTTAVSGGYQLKDATRGNGETRDAQNLTATNDSPPAGWGKAFTDTGNVWGNGTLSDRATVAADAHFGIQATWDYYKNVHGRSGIKNDGVGARSFVHYGNNYANAGWDDTSFSMIYGDGAPGDKPFTELDVAGHEMSHGVTSATANLNYFGDAGGLNESTSDIFGTLVEFNANSAVDTPDYLIGEKISSTPLRYMDDPKKDGASQSCWTTGTKNLDPHYSSGVGNHFFYLLAVGSGSSQWGNSPTCDGGTVTGLGNATAGKIWYRALTTYMTSGTTYPQARTASIKAATDLYGAASSQCAAVEKAWSGVAVAPTATTCGGGGTPPSGSNLLSNPGFESGAVNWTASSGVVTNDASGTPHSGSYYAWLDGYGSAHTDTLSQSVTVPATAAAPKLSFFLAIDTKESGTTPYDTLKAQVVNGTSTTTLATYSNATPGGYTQRTLDLSAFKGKTVTIKFTGTEDSSAATSFLIDDTAVTTG
ncbi:M4 family metallopeptidase [Streptomyces sp. HB132]|uniref:M4 family metallopeptidase n=1 Tax=Streptomyces sp. HB132 TaxID=767388 RepID=UPI0019618CA0|nr:M4 family metallopeptidase [Streptomyces sp. HB132]MBM7440518.1 Zn-dependent metalloprotease [Streptomyces sp. HB132]